MPNRGEIIGKIIDILPEPIHIQVFVKNTKVVFRANAQTFDDHVKDLISEALKGLQGCNFNIEWVNEEDMIISLELK